MTMQQQTRKSTRTYLTPFFTIALCAVTQHSSALTPTSSGSGYTLTGTIARPDSTPALASADGRYSLSGGPLPDHTSPRCPADFAPPTGLLDLADIIAWIDAFETGDPLADYAAPFGLLDLADVIGFVNAFTTGCD